MPLANLTAIPWQYHNDDGSVMAGGTINFYTPGTTTAKAIYEDNAQATSAANPQTLDAAGRWDSGGLFFDGLYDVVVKDSDGNTKFTVSNWGTDWSAVGTDLSANPLSNHSFETAGTGSEPCANWTATDSGSVITRATSGVDDPQHGTACLLFTGSNNGSDYMTSDAFEIDENMDVTLAFDVKVSNANCEPKIEINWLDRAQSSISTSTFYDDSSTSTSTSWTRIYGLNLTPPDTTCYAKLKVTGNAAGTVYNTHFDNIVIGQVNTFGDQAPFQPWGLEISRDSGDTSHDINVTKGAVKDATFAYDMVLTSEITKQMDAVWAQGDDAGGTDGTSLPTSGIYYIWLIKNLTTGHVDVLGSTSSSSPSMPSGWGAKRLIGAWLTDSSANLAAGLNKGRIFIFHEPLLSIDDDAYTNNANVTASIDAPPESLAFVRMTSNYPAVASGDYIYFAISHTDTDLSSPDSATDGKENFGVQWQGSTLHIDEYRAECRVLVDTSGQIEYNVATGGSEDPDPGVDIHVWGWDMLTRDYP